MAAEAGSAFVGVFSNKPKCRVVIACRRSIMSRSPPLLEFSPTNRNAGWCKHAGEAICPVPRLCWSFLQQTEMQGGDSMPARHYGAAWACVLSSDITPLNCRGGCYFCLDTKVTKKSSHQEGFFAAHGLCAQTMKNLGLQSFCPGSRTCPPLHAKSCYALPGRTALPVFPGFFPKLSC